jgi:hypothetical protein
MFYYKAVKMDAGKRPFDDVIPLDVRNATARTVNINEFAFAGEPAIECHVELFEQILKNSELFMLFRDLLNRILVTIYPSGRHSL